jgi:hypothetical protein
VSSTEQEPKTLGQMARVVMGDVLPEREALDRWKGQLSEAEAKIFELILNLRLVVQWQGWGVEHERLTRVMEEPERLAFDVRVYSADEHHMARSAFRDAELVVGNFRAYNAGVGGWLRVTVRDGMLRRLQAISK